MSKTEEKEFRETVWEHVEGNKTATIYTAEKKFINELNKLADKYPEDVQIRTINPDGSLVVWVDAERYKPKWKVKLELTDEQREERRKRIKKSIHNTD